MIHHSKLQELAKINLEQTQVQDIWVVGDGEHRYIPFQQLLSQQKKLQQEDVDENKLAAIYYTSGSTGNPKAVMHSHKTLYQGLLNGAELLESHHNSVLVMKQPLGHMGAYLQTFSNLLHGATTILTNDFDEYALAIKQHHPTMLVCLPTLLNEVMHCEILDESCFENLELVTSGGDKVPLALQQLVKQRTGLPVKEHYGSSEAWIVTKNIYQSHLKTPE